MRGKICPDVHPGDHFQAEQGKNVLGWKDVFDNPNPLCSVRDICRKILGYIPVDEPTIGLDPEERVRFHNLLSDLSGKHIILPSTHIVSDVEAAATEIDVINQGRKLQQAAPEKLLQLLEGHVWQ